MTNTVNIDEKRLQRSLDEMSIRALLNEDDLDEGMFDREEVTTAVLDRMHALIAPLTVINSENWPDFYTVIEKIRSEVDGIATRGGFGRFFMGKGGKRAKDLVDGLTQLKLYARELGNRIKPDADNVLAKAIHNMPDEDKDKELGTVIIDPADRQTLKAYIYSLHREHNNDKVLDKLDFDRDVATAAILQLKAKDIDSIVRVLNGIPLPPPRERETGDGDGDGIIDALDTAPGDPDPAAAPGSPTAPPAGGEAGGEAGGGEEAEEPAGGGTISPSEFGELVARDRELWRAASEKGEPGRRARVKIRDLLKGKCFGEAINQRLRFSGLGLLAEEVDAGHGHAQEVTDFRRWRHLAGME